MFVLGGVGDAALAVSPAGHPARFATGGQRRPLADRPAPAYDVRPLGNRRASYLGWRRAGAAGHEPGRPEFADQVGKTPNISPSSRASTTSSPPPRSAGVHQYGRAADGALGAVQGELADIAAGGTTRTSTSSPTRCAGLNLPVAHHLRARDERPLVLLGRQARPHRADYVAAWRHIHDVFDPADADERDLDLDPNVVNPVPSVKLAPLYPGDAYVDWVGIDGYYTHRGAQTSRACSAHDHPDPHLHPATAPDRGDRGRAGRGTVGLDHGPDRRDGR